MATAKKPVKHEVEAYLAKVPPVARAPLERLRKTIKSAAPKATEELGWGMPLFRQGRHLVGYAAFKQHCSFFIMSVKVLEAHATELAPWRSSKGTLRFTAEHPLPAALVKKLVKARLAEEMLRDR